ncbi:DUF465 domain-containing protein [Hyphobacterium sp. SN044]|uniref:YdcH family protein n=1 Tax=Hyphobacterium sp. SN044 TaxID=2912575 RepID=UPI001F3C5A42|nr:DUF465 domain-containing protein [Hyphobacterium sp. SN044]MCF8879990.1 DUF465 domain-containing protein [Hyphobacterium sp. SN044]
MGEDFLDQDALRARIMQLRSEHRALDGQITALIETGVADQLKIARLKKEKLFLKDRISALEDQMTPDIIA